MKNYTLLTIGCVLLILATGSLVLSQTTLTRTDKTITIPKDKLDTLKSNLSVSSIAPDVSKITCDDHQCWATIYQANVIQTDWRVDKNYCSNIYTDINGTMRCLRYIDYTTAQLEQMRDSFISQRLQDYADYLQNKSYSTTEVVGEGKLTFANPK